ncbi:rCG61730 [Rattus norvegicus]|uniref:RCG61730 n=2 Tax=Rattus norvegicus TaxID=10116 RepID=A6HBS4_RAT|nr:rCG61730 [Rattus norvegicus]|eukprot:XP_017450044.1 PREDICTED: uncharacterized protein LOC108351365 [Rattus norvegicus]
MEDTTDDPDETSSGTLSEALSNEESSGSSTTGEGRARSQKQRLRRPTKDIAHENLPQIMNTVQSVLEENSEAKKKGRKRTILVFYYRQNGKKKQNQEKKKEQAAETSQSSDSDSPLPGSSQDTGPSALSLPKRVRKWFFQ